MLAVIKIAPAARGEATRGDATSSRWPSKIAAKQLFMIMTKASYAALSLALSLSARDQRVARVGASPEKYATKCCATLFRIMAAIAMHDAISHALALSLSHSLVFYERIKHWQQCPEQLFNASFCSSWRCDALPLSPGVFV